MGISACFVDVYVMDGITQEPEECPNGLSAEREKLLCGWLKNFTWCSTDAGQADETQWSMLDRADFRIGP